MRSISSSAFGQVDDGIGNGFCRPVAPVIYFTASARDSTCWTFYRGVDVNTSVDEFHDVLPTLRVPRAGGIGVGQLVDKDKGGLSCENALKVHFSQFRAPVVGVTAGENGQPGKKGFGFDPAVRFYYADNDVDLAGRTFLSVRPATRLNASPCPRQGTYLRRTLCGDRALDRASSFLSEARIASGSGL